MKSAALPVLICLCLGAPAGADGIQLSGTAEMGLVGGSAYEGGAQLLTGVEATVLFSTTTDGGLTIGFEADLSELMTEDGLQWPPSSPRQSRPPYHPRFGDRALE